MTDYVDLLPVVVETSGAVMPEGFDSWGLKSVRPDLTTTRNFRWSMPGGVNVSNDRLVAVNGGACPEWPGDGLCVATTWYGMASGGIPARTLILVAYRAADVVGRDKSAGKLRIGAEVATVALIDGERLIHEHGSRANLRGANLRGTDLRAADLPGADLCGADLQGADLQGADLQGADLRGADLRGAKLQHADLRGARLRGANLQHANLLGADLQGAEFEGAKLQRADLEYANLRDANLRDANLEGANLQYADLRHADLRGADLRRAELGGADLQHADLQGADLYGAYLQGSDLKGAVWSASITPPDGWTLTSSGLLTRKATR